MCRKSSLGASRAVSSISNVAAPSSGKMVGSRLLQEQVSADTNPKLPNLKKENIRHTPFFFLFFCGGMNTVPDTPFSLHYMIIFEPKIRIKSVKINLHGPDFQTDSNQLFPLD